ncbi:MAG: hypothetical protein H9872_03100 [Candidatus Cellulosilyticum pullistercoris]|uniref:Thoeris protein ThsA Macro domain-containing protein n=1 Tax=Candidatus Cellulosilyticum pullistercoris TaxID=2838521 RepID=A0A9E2NK51_9FIRM|nr:hypothetical protein [Candidatus Cellulosilyticum pullistercoris]
MIELIKKSSAWTLSIISGVFTVVPESFFAKIKLISSASDELNIILSRVLALILVLVVVVIIMTLYLSYRKSVQIKGHNYSIQIEYGDIFQMSSCKKVIAFDECFTTSVGSAPGDVKPTSVCGQYLNAHPIQDMQGLIDATGLKPAKRKSDYEKKVRYESGKLVPNGDYLLMAFAKLDEKGLGGLTRDQFLDALSTLWEEIDRYYGQEDVCITILGSGITRMKGESLTQQQLLDIIIASYQLSSSKIKSPYKLHIVCQRKDDFSLNKIGENL